MKVDPYIPISFGFDTACRAYSELIGNLGHDTGKGIIVFVVIIVITTTTTTTNTTTKQCQVRNTTRWFVSWAERRPISYWNAHCKRGLTYA